MVKQPHRNYSQAQPDPEFPELDDPQLERELPDPDVIEGGVAEPDEAVDPDSTAADVTDDMVELVTYPSKADADMLLSMLENVEIEAELHDIAADQSSGASTSPAAGTPGADNPSDISGFSATIYPEGVVRILVHDADFDEAQRVMEEYEEQREAMRLATEPEREPQDIEGVEQEGE